MIYWDSSVLLKLYASEADSEQWQARALREGKPLRSSALVLAEVAFALRQKERREEIRRGASRDLYRLFREDVTMGRIQVFPLGPDVLEKCAALADLSGSRKDARLRTLAGLHLATATLLKCRKIATADLRMQSAARALGFKIYA